MEPKESPAQEPGSALDQVPLQRIRVPRDPLGRLTTDPLNVPSIPFQIHSASVLFLFPLKACDAWRLHRINLDVNQFGNTKELVGRYSGLSIILIHVHLLLIEPVTP